MASIEPRTRGWALKWRYGGARAGAPQTLTFVPYDPDDQRSREETYRYLLAAKQVVEARNHAMLRDEVRRFVFGEPDDAPPGGIPTFAGWLTEWVTVRRAIGDIQPDTLDKYERILRHRAEPFFGAKVLTEIHPDTVREWVGWMVASQRRPDGKPLSPQTVRRCHAILHGCLGAAVPRWIPANPAARPAGARKHVGLPKGTHFEGLFLEEWEWERIIGNCSAHIRGMAVVAIRTGMRLGELIALRRQDVMLGGDVPHILVRRALKGDGSVGDPKSVKSRRKIDLPKGLAALLAEQVRGLKPGDLVFRAPLGGMWSEQNLRNRFWLPAVAAAQRCGEHPPPTPGSAATGPVRKFRPDEVSTCGCPGVLTRTPRFHDLRHSHASALIHMGKSPKEVQLRLGHASHQITMDIYGHLWERKDTGDLDALDDIFAA